MGDARGRRRLLRCRRGAAGLAVSQLDDAVGPQGLPKIYAVVLAALSLVLMARSAGRRGKGEGVSAEDAHTSQRRALGRVGGMLAIGVLYVIAAPWIGYIPALAALILVTIYYQGGALDRRAGLVAVSGAVLFWVLFVFVLGIPQPAGFWSSLF
jgi:putative tricarboxylic transport membrane protein